MTQRYRLSTAFLFFLFSLLSFNASNAQLIEDFEQGTKGFWAAASVDLTSGTWFFDEALLGTDDRDRKFDTKAVRMRSNGRIIMQFDKTGGIENISFHFSNSGFSNDTGGRIQAQYSLDGGSTWVDAGDEISATDQLVSHTIPVNQPGDIRVRIEHRAGGRVNIDDLILTDFVKAQEEPTIDVIVNNLEISTGSLLELEPVNLGNKSTETIRIRNRGNQTLEINGVSIQDSQVFTTTPLQNTSLEFNESVEFDVEFEPIETGVFNGTLVVSSNAANTPEFELSLTSEAFSESSIIPISEAREVPFGTRVTVSGRITAGNEFSGPAYFQDETAGIAAFWEPFHSQAVIGDSIIITGPVTEFNPISGTPGTFLRQIGVHNGDDDITFEIISDSPRIVEPAPVTIQEMNAGGFESELVIIENVNINFSGNFQGNTNYEINDGTATGEMRIDNDTNLVGVTAPGEPVNIVGVVGQFNGVFQLLPRFAEDLGAEPVILPGDDVSKDQTFDVVTWNIEWFGDPSNGPSDTELQLENVKTVITTIDADLYAFQEISNSSQFNRLVNELQEYSGFEAGFSQQQKTAFLFKKATVDSLDSGLINQGMISFDWANGRLPLMFRFDASIEGMNREIFAFNIHAKALADEESYNRRVRASSQMKSFLDNNHLNDNVIFIGDYNDDVTVSTYNEEVSPYQNFVNDVNYLVITKTLSDQGATSFRSLSMIDHITINSAFVPDYFEGTERVENPNFIGSFLSSTSDHFPVSTRFSFSESVSIDDEIAGGLPENFSLEQNFPNPFNPVTQIQFNLPSAQQVNLDVYNVLGQRVSNLLSNEARSAGTHTVSFDASRFSSGVYFYRLSLQNGEQLTRKMMLVK